MAVFNMRVNPNVSVSKALGFNPRGVVVQNFTPYWLYFPQADQYCPPWTDGWTAPLILNSNGYGYMQIQTPIGRTVQPNVTPGVEQFVNLQWTDQDVSYTEGTPGDTGQSVDPLGDAGSASVVQIKSASTAFECFTSTENVGNFVAAPGATKHLRLLTMSGYVLVNNLIGPMSDSLARASLTSQTVPQFSGPSIVVGWAQPSFPLVFPAGVDWPVNEPIRWLGRAMWANTTVSVNITYQVIG